MNHYYRFFPDGSCDIICTRCFLKIGKGQEPSVARRQADSHICQVDRYAASLARAAAQPVKRSRVLRRVSDAGMSKMPAPLLLLLAALVFYFLPTLLEFAVLRHASLWAVGMMLGDLTGCIGIFVALKKRKLAVILYLALTTGECWLYATRLLSADSLVWLMDMVPTVVIAIAILRPHARMARLGA